MARAEYGFALLCCSIAVYLHRSEINWAVGFALFWYIDVFSTFPALVAFHWSRNGLISRIYYVAYNFLHSAVTQGLVVLVWTRMAGWHWELLALPIHLSVDRAIFNNYPKPFGIAFDPVIHPAFLEFCESYRSYSTNQKFEWKRPAETGVASV